MKKIVIFGSGEVATQTARALYDALKNPGFSQRNQEVKIYMMARNALKGEAKLRDIAADNRPASLAFLSSTTNVSKIKSADVIIFAMGVPAGKTGAIDRNKNLGLNMEIVETYAPQIKKYAPYALILVLSNPVELLLHRMQEIIGCPNDKILGLGLELDRRRFGENLAARIKTRFPSSNITGSMIDVEVLGMHSADGITFLTNALKIAGTQKLLRAELSSRYHLDEAGWTEMLAAAEAETRGEGITLVYSNDGRGSSHGPGGVARDVTLAYLYGPEFRTYAAINVGSEGYMQVVPANCVTGVPLLIAHGSIRIIKTDLSESKQKSLASVCEKYNKMRAAFALEQEYRHVVFAPDKTRTFNYSSSIFAVGKIQGLDDARRLYLFGQYAEAAALLGQHKIISRSSVDILRIELDLGMCFYMQARYTEALDCFKRAAELWRKLHQDYSKEIQILNQAIAMLEEQKDDRLILPDVLKIDKKLPTNFLGDISRIFNNLGNLCQTPKLFFMKFLLYQTAADISENRAHEPNSSDLYYAIARANLASLLAIQGEFEDAQREHLAVIIVLNAYFSNDINEGLQTRGSAYNELGNLYFYSKDYTAALDCYLYARKLLLEFSQNQHQGSNHPDLALCCFNLGMCYEKLGNKDSAIAHLETARSSFERNGLINQVTWCVERLTLMRETSQNILARL